MRRKRHGISIGAVILLLLVICIAALVLIFNIKMNKIDFQEGDSSSITMNEGLKDKLSSHNVLNVALFGVDSREGNLENANSDTIIVASINKDTKEVKLVSVYRDTLLDIGENSYQKCNAAYAYGGPQRAVTMLNQNLDLDIESYLTVDFNAVAELVDAVGGITLALTDEEVVHMNNYCVETSQVTGKSYEPIFPEVAGTYDLNGVQAVSYSRIRYTAGSDFKRTERQRQVIQLVMNKLRSAPWKVFDIMDKVFPMVKTNMDKMDILSMGTYMLMDSMGDTTGFPFDLTTADLAEKGSCVVPLTLDSNVRKLHQLLYGVETYEPTQGILDRSYTVSAVSGYY